MPVNKSEHLYIALTANPSQDWYCDST